VIELPFSAAEWNRVNKSTLALTNATLADDEVLRAVYLNELQTVLAELRNRYGDHPVLLETEADFLDDRCRQCQLYRQAIQIAVAQGLPTFSIRVSLARVLLEEFNDYADADTELAACEPELRLNDDYDRKGWFELAERCRCLAADGDSFATIRAKYQMGNE
jgi:hypothetical protein